MFSFGLAIRLLVCQIAVSPVILTKKTQGVLRATIKTMTNWCFTNDPRIFIVTVALAICSVNTNIKCNKYELACLEAIHVFSHIYGDRQEQNIITKVKTESQNPKTKSQNPKQNHKTQNRITKPKTESQNSKQNHKTQNRITKP